MITPLRFWLIFAAVGGLLALLAYLGTRRRTLRPLAATVPHDPDDPGVCGRCGYDVRGQTGNICPECGADLNDVGRVRPGVERRRLLPLLSRVVIWTLIVGAIGSAFYITGSTRAVPHVRSNSWWSTFTPRNLRADGNMAIVIESQGANRMVFESLEALRGQQTGSFPGRFIDRPRTFTFSVAPPTTFLPTGPPRATLEMDRLNGTWRLEINGNLVTGTGQPPPTVVLAALRGARAGPSQQSPQDLVAAAGAEASDEEFRVAVALWLLTADAPTRALYAGSRDHQDLMNNPSLPRPLLAAIANANVGYGSHVGQPLPVPREGLYDLVETKRGGTQMDEPHRNVLIAAGAAWLAVWLTGLYFVTRRRAVIVR